MTESKRCRNIFFTYNCFKNNFFPREIISEIGCCLYELFGSPHPPPQKKTLSSFLPFAAQCSSQLPSSFAGEYFSILPQAERRGEKNEVKTGVKLQPFSFSCVRARVCVHLLRWTGKKICRCPFRCSIISENCFLGGRRKRERLAKKKYSRTPIQRKKHRQKLKCNRSITSIDNLKRFW